MTGLIEVEETSKAMERIYADLDTDSIDSVPDFNLQSNSSTTPATQGEKDAGASSVQQPVFIIVQQPQPMQTVYVLPPPMMYPHSGFFPPMPPFPFTGAAKANLHHHHGHGHAQGNREHTTPTFNADGSKVVRCYYCGEVGHKACHCKSNPYSSTVSTSKCSLHNKTRSVTYLRPMDSDPTQLVCVPENPCLLH